MTMMVQHQAEMRAQMVQMQTHLEAMAKQLSEVHACTVTISATSSTSTAHTGGDIPMSTDSERGESKSAHEPSGATDKAHVSQITTVAPALLKTAKLTVTGSHLAEPKPGRRTPMRRWVAPAAA